MQSPQMKLKIMCRKLKVLVEMVFNHRLFNKTKTFMNAYKILGTTDPALSKS